MAFFDFTKRLTLGMKIIYAIVAVGIITAAVIGIVMSRKNLQAKTMRIVRTGGTVRLEQTEGPTKNVTKKTRFQSGDSVLTGTDGSATVEMDDTKIITLQSESRAEFTKKNGQYELRLTKGGLFFDVSERLKEGESFDLKTTNMNVGIKGTSGYIFYDEQGRDSLILTDGNAIITATNPDNGEKKYAEVRGGQKLTVSVFPDKVNDSVEVIIEDVTEKDLPDFVLLTIADSNSLLNRVCESNGWSRNTMLVLVDNLIKSSANVTVSTDVSEPSGQSSVAATPTPKTAETVPDATATSETTQTQETSESDEGSSDNDTRATATPKPTVTPTPTKKPTNTPKPTNTSTPTPKPTPSNTPTPSPTPTPTNTPIPTPPEPTETEPEPTEPEPVLTGFYVTVEVVSLADDGTEETSVTTVGPVPADGDEPRWSALDTMLSIYESYTVLGYDPIYE